MAIRPDAIDILSNIQIIYSILRHICQSVQVISLRLYLPQTNRYSIIDRQCIRFVFLERTQSFQFHGMFLSRRHLSFRFCIFRIAPPIRADWQQDFHTEIYAYCTHYCMQQAVIILLPRVLSSRIFNSNINLLFWCILCFVNPYIEELPSAIISSMVIIAGPRLNITLACPGIAFSSIAAGLVSFFLPLLKHHCQPAFEMIEAIPHIWLAFDYSKPFTESRKSRVHIRPQLFSGKWL